MTFGSTLVLCWLEDTGSRNPSPPLRSCRITKFLVALIHLSRKNWVTCDPGAWKNSGWAVELRVPTLGQGIVFLSLSVLDANIHVWSWWPASQSSKKKKSSLQGSAQIYSAVWNDFYEFLLRWSVVSKRLKGWFGPRQCLLNLCRAFVMNPEVLRFSGTQDRIGMPFTGLFSLKWCAMIFLQSEQKGFQRCFWILETFSQQPEFRADVVVCLDAQSHGLLKWLVSLHVLRSTGFSCIYPPKVSSLWMAFEHIRTWEHWIMPLCFDFVWNFNWKMIQTDPSRIKYPALSHQPLLKVLILHKPLENFNLMHARRVLDLLRPEMETTS